MLNKDELRKLRTLKATPAMLKAAKDNDIPFCKMVKSSWGQDYKRKYSRKFGYFLRCQNLGPYLKIAIFFSIELNKGIYTPRYELFINLDTEE